MGSSTGSGGPKGQGKTASGKHVMPMSSSHQSSVANAKSMPGKGGKSGGKKGGGRKGY